MPPLSLLLIGGAGAIVQRRQKVLGWLMMIGSALLLAALSTPQVASRLLGSLQQHDALNLHALEESCGAIVVLAGDAQLHAPEYGDASCGPLTLERLRYAARLHRASRLPLLVSGGAPRQGVRAHAAMMKEALERDFDVDVRWVEDRSADTEENLRNSAEMLAAAGVTRAYLVTHAWHMPRALEWASTAELEVVAAPTGFRAQPTMEMKSFVPSAKALRETNWALHEWLGRLWWTIAG